MRDADSGQHDGLSSDSGRVEFPCSQSQLRFWIEEQLSPQNPALNVAVRWRLEGQLPHAILEAAWQRIINRHDPLRTFLRAVDGDPVQIVEPRVTFSIPTFDLRTLPEFERSQEADRLAESEARKPFDVGVAPLIRVTRVVVGDLTSILLVTAHHTVCDGWSVGILAREMGQICAALASGVVPFLPDLGLRFGEFAEWERASLAQGSFESERTAMRAMLRDYRQFELLPDRPRPSRMTANSAIASILLDRPLTDSLASVARKNGATLFMTALAAMFVLLHRYTGENDIVLGTQVVGRDEEELENLVGCFINTIALRGDLSGEPDFLTLLGRVREMVSDTFDMRALPLQQLVEIAQPVRDPSRNALFSVNFIFQRSFIANESYGKFSLVDLPSRSAGALYDLNMFMVERPEGWRVSCEYNTDLFDAATMDGLLDHFMTLLDSIVEDPSVSVSRMKMLRESERLALISEVNRTEAPFPAEKTVWTLVIEQMRRTPENVAVVCGDCEVTYAQLETAVAKLAAELMRRGCGAGSRVGILLDRSIQMVVAMLAVLKNGAAYVPMDPRFPSERLKFIASDAELAATITRSALGSDVGDAFFNRVLIEEGEFTVEQPDVDQRDVLSDGQARPGDVAYVIYTSGSTGKPKGVAIQHRSLVNFLWSMRLSPGCSTCDTLVAVTTISFDIAGLEIFLPLITGAKLVIATETDIVDGSGLLRLLKKSGATILQATPVTWQLLIDAGWSGDPQLSMLCGGEALSRSLATELLARGSELWNMYGPTETTIWSATARVVPGSGPVPIGRPIANTHFYVLDREGELLPRGVPGELYIGGEGVARGYFKRDALSAERFLPNRFLDDASARMYRTGDLVRLRGQDLEFLGRLDDQVKLRGFRIELDEISSVLLRQPGVFEAVAVVVKDSLGESSIRAYVAPRLGFQFDREDWPGLLRVSIAEFLPNYMLPSTITVLDQLPRTPNGKIDRAALPITWEGASSDSLHVPESSIEATIAAVVGDLLGHKKFTSGDDLFRIGLHSLLAVRLAARLSRAFELGVPLRTVFENPTISGLAKVVDGLVCDHGAADSTSGSAFVTYNEGGVNAPLFFFHNDAAGGGMFCRRIAQVVGSSQPLVAIAPHGMGGLPTLTTIEAMAGDYLHRLRAMRPHGPYRLGGFCAGGLVAFELARMLTQEGERVEPILLVNSSAPPRRAVLFGDRLLRKIGLNSRLKPSLRVVLCWNIVRLFDALGKGPRSTLAFLASRYGSLSRRITGAPNSRFNEPEPVNPNPTAEETQSYFANLVAAYTYHPGSYDGEVVFMWGADQPPTSSGPFTGWDRVASRMRLVSLPGRHLTPIKEGVDELGRIIAAELSR